MICDSYTNVQRIGTKWEEFKEEEIKDRIVQRSVMDMVMKAKK